MKIVRRFQWLAAIVALVVALGALLALPAWAAPSRQATNPPSDNLAAMQAACTAGDISAMQGAMDSMTEANWEAMQGHMAANGGMMGGMMNGQPANNMMGW